MSVCARSHCSTAAGLSLGLFLGLFACSSLSAFSPQAKGGERAQWREAKRAFDDWWKRVENLQLQLQGGERNPEPARTNRREAARLLAELARNLEAKDAAPMLWRVALFEVDPEQALGVPHLRTAPWYLRTEARKALAALPPAEIVPWLLEQGQRKSSKAKELSPRLAASEVLGVIGGERVRTALLALFEKADERERIEMAEDLARALPGDDAALEAVLSSVDSKSISARCASVHACAGIASRRVDETLPPSERKPLPAPLAEKLISKLGFLALEDASWQVRLAACDALARLRCRAGIAALVQAFARESERLQEGERVEVRNRVHELLEGVTGQSIGAEKPEWWKDWWAKNGGTFAVGEAAAKAQARAEKKGSGYLEYFQIEITSDRILFIVDRSGSMNEPAKATDRYGRAEKGATTKFAFVQDELERLLQALPPTTRVNVLFFSDGVEAFRTADGGRPELIELSPRGKNEIVRYVRNIAANGGTNLYDALDRALDIAGRGVKDGAYDTAYDTIYLLSDGKPTAGPVIDEQEILRRVEEVNALRRIKIHAVTFGDRNNGDFIGELAKRTGGRHVHVD